MTRQLSTAVRSGLKAPQVVGHCSSTRLGLACETFSPLQLVQGIRRRLLSTWLQYICTLYDWRRLRWQAECKVACIKHSQSACRPLHAYLCLSHMYIHKDAAASYHYCHPHSIQRQLPSPAAARGVHYSFGSAYKLRGYIYLRALTLLRPFFRTRFRVFHPSRPTP
jgi:hypothetical protein